MKLRKMKLVALALSAAMVMSAMSPVAFAEEEIVISDEATAEEVAENDGIAIASEAPAPITTSEAVSTGIMTVASGDGESSDGEVQKDYVFDSIEPGSVKFEYDATEDAIVVKYVKVYKKDGAEDKKIDATATPTKLSGKDSISGEVLSKDADCETPEQAFYSVELEKNAKGDKEKYRSKEMLNVPGGQEALGHAMGLRNIELKQPTCTDKGSGQVWYTCTRDNCPQKDHLTDPDYIKGAEERGPITDIPALGHSFTIKNVITSADEATEAGDATKRPMGCYVNDDGTAEIIPEYEENDWDAYYWVKKTCERCEAVDAVEWEQVWVNKAPRNEWIVYTVADNNNVEHLVVEYKDENGKTQKQTVTTTNGIVGTDIKVVDTVLGKCTQDGYYLEQHWTRDGKASENKIEVAAHHAWGTTEVWIESKNTDYKLLLTKSGTALTDNKQTLANQNALKVTRDSSNNVIEAYSNTCAKSAKYELYHVCQNSDCGKKESCGVKVAEPSTTHKFGVWANDKENYSYEMIDENEHWVTVAQKRICDDCKLVEERTLEPVKEKHGALTTRKVAGTEIEATCGTAGSYETAQGCPNCEYVKEDTITLVKVPATEKHEFGENPAFITWTGEVWVGPRYNPTYSVNAKVVRTCNVCGHNVDTGIMTRTTAGGYVSGGILSHDSSKGVTVDLTKNVVPGKKDPATGRTFSCSPAMLTVYANWRGTVDGESVSLQSEYEVPYYANTTDYQARTAHIPGQAVKEIKPTATEAGSYDEVIRCLICGDEISRKTVTVNASGQLPKVTGLKAEVAGNGKVKLTWDAVEGADAYAVLRLVQGSTSVMMGTPTTNTWTDNDANTDKFNFYWVIAIDLDENKEGTAGEFDSTNYVWALPRVIGKVAKVNAQAGKNGVALDWELVDGANKYVVLSRVGDPKAESKTVTVNGTSYVDKSAKAGDVVYYWVYGVYENADGAKCAAGATSPYAWAVAK